MSTAEAIAIVKDECAKHNGHILDDDAALFLLWNETGWPEFFATDDVERHIREQIRDGFAGE